MSFLHLVVQRWYGCSENSLIYLGNLYSPSGLQLSKKYNGTIAERMFTALKTLFLVAYFYIYVNNFYSPEISFFYICQWCIATGRKKSNVLPLDGKMYLFKSTCVSTCCHSSDRISHGSLSICQLCVQLNKPRFHIE